MKRAVAPLVLVCALASVAGARGSPAFRDLAFQIEIGTRWYRDYVTIVSVSTTTRLVKGYITVCPECIITGYYNGTTCFLQDDACQTPYINGWYFSFGKGPAFAKHLGIRSGVKPLEAEWHPMTAKWLGRPATNPAPDPSAYLRAQMLRALTDARSGN